MSDSFPRGRFVWFDLMTSDPDAAKSFYGEVIGWGSVATDVSDTPYNMWTNGETPMGGFMQLPPDAESPPHWLGYVAVPDVDGAVAAVEAAGGSVLVPSMEIPEVGRFAVFSDPQGGAIAVYRPSGEVPGHDGPPQVGEFSWRELMTTDHEAAFDFYSEIFGWQKGEPMDMGPAGTYQLYHNGGLPLGGMMNKPPEMPVPAWLYYVRVADLDAAVEKVKQLGGTILNGPMDVPGGDRIAQCTDPQGAAFALHVTANA